MKKKVMMSISLQFHSYLWDNSESVSEVMQSNIPYFDIINVDGALSCFHNPVEGESDARFSRSCSPYYSHLKLHSVQLN